MTLYIDLNFRSFFSFGISERSQCTKLLFANLRNSLQRCTQLWLCVKLMLEYVWVDRSVGTPPAGEP